MKLAEALIVRAACQNRVNGLTDRLQQNVKVQEGEQPPENPQELLAELEATFTELARLIQQINRANSSTSFQSGTLSDALAERDILKLKHKVYSKLVQTACEREYRYSRSEIRSVCTVNVRELQHQLDSLAQNYRILDAQIQALNWQVDLPE